MSDYLASFEILKILNYTADCPIAILWHESVTQRLAWKTHEYVGLENNTLNAAFISSAWPLQRNATEAQMNDFYDAIYTTNVASWIQVALTAIETDCLGPDLAEKVAFANLDSSKNCLSTAAFYANTVCAVNPKTSLKQQPNTTYPVPLQAGGGWGFWQISAIPPALNSTLGFKMLRDAWPYNASNITDATLRAWIPLAVQGLTSISSEGSTPTVCQKCLPQLCSALGFVSDPDIDGIGVGDDPARPDVQVTDIQEQIMTAYTILCVCVFTACLCKITLEVRRGFETLYNATKAAHMLLIGTSVSLLFSLSIAGYIALEKALTSYYEILMTGHAVLLSTLAVISNLLMVSEKDFKEIEAVNRWLLGIILVPTCAVFIVVTTKLATFKTNTYSDEACLKAGMPIPLHPMAWSHAPLALAALVALVLPAIFRIFLVPKAERKDWEDGWPKLHMISRFVTLFLSFASALLMIVALVMMWLMRRTMHDITANRASDIWGTGQFLAVLGFITVPLAFLAVLINDMVGCTMVVWSALQRWRQLIGLVRKALLLILTVSNSELRATEVSELPNWEGPSAE